MRTFERQKYTSRRTRFWFAVIDFTLRRLLKESIVHVRLLHVFNEDAIDIGGFKPLVIDITADHQQPRSLD